MRFEKISLKWKIFIYLFIFTVLLLGVLWLSQIVFLNSFYKHIKVNEIERVAQMISEQDFGEREEFQAFLGEISDLKRIDIEVISRDNETIFSSQNGRGNFFRLTQQDREFIINETRASNSFRMVYSHKDIAFFTGSRPNEIVGGEVDIARAIENRVEVIELIGQGIEVVHRMPIIAQSEEVGSSNPISIAIRAHGLYRNNFVNEEWLLYAKTVNNGDIILIRSLITPIDTTVDTLRIQLYYITIFMILISIVVSIVVAKRISKPIEKINSSAKNLAKGNYNVDFSCLGYKEIIELSDTLNYAAVELSKVENLRRELIANISHDLRTPLTLISGFAEMMRDLPEENTKENAAVIVEETTRLTSIVNDLLEFSKLQAGVQNMELKEYSLTESLISVVNTLNELIKKDGYKVNFTCKKDFFVKSDEAKIKQVFYNLLINAVNYSGENKQVDVIIEEENNRVTVKVKDYGEGIEKENLPYIWERYYKIDKVHKRAVTGSGIGLSIVKNILDMCPNTKYGADSQVGVGSTFYFSLEKIG